MSELIENGRPGEIVSEHDRRVVIPLGHVNKRENDITSIELRRTSTERREQPWLDDPSSPIGFQRYSVQVLEIEEAAEHVGFRFRGTDDYLAVFFVVAEPRSNQHPEIH